MSEARGRLRNGDTRAAFLFLSPWLVGFLLWTAYPVVYTAYLSLTDYDVINDPTFVGTENYREMLTDDKVTLALGNTAIYAVLSVPFQLGVSLALALLLQRAGRARGLFRTAFFLPKMTPPVAIGVLVLLLLNGQSGLLNESLSWVGIDGPNWTTDPPWVKPGLALMSLWTIGAEIIILLAALENVPRELWEAARVDGASWWGRFRHVTLPMISGPLYFLALVDTIAAFQSFTEAYTAYFGAGNSTYGNDAALFYVIYVFQQAFEFLHMGYAAALAMLLFLVVLVVTAGQSALTRRYVFYYGDQR
ncbi:spermidine/putrescine ABC transporter permease [Nocardioides gansuensis]|uniref:Spermidine/putrescine ABC transporter permease n=1 Tax=Nocardioides gansuensis TaxID=2138300 RepID=A0A2T8F5I0_9ACTN|nr:sugar ABC transporter permease [Nocardioides gansuensis]PVG80942.1 spermidine/putrescine ABC transporter permease [Nocardioides gansuensis]